MMHFFAPFSCCADSCRFTAFWLIFGSKSRVSLRKCQKNTSKILETAYKSKYDTGLSIFDEKWSFLVIFLFPTPANVTWFWSFFGLFYLPKFGIFSKNTTLAESLDFWSKIFSKNPEVRAVLWVLAQKCPKITGDFQKSLPSLLLFKRFPENRLNRDSQKMTIPLKSAERSVIFKKHGILVILSHDFLKITSLSAEISEVVIFSFMSILP